MMWVRIALGSFGLVDAPIQAAPASFCRGALRGGSWGAPASCATDGGSSDICEASRFVRLAH